MNKAILWMDARNGACIPTLPWDELHFCYASCTQLDIHEIANINTNERNKTQRGSSSDDLFAQTHTHRQIRHLYFIKIWTTGLDNLLKIAVTHDTYANKIIHWTHIDIVRARKKIEIRSFSMIMYELVFHGGLTYLMTSASSKLISRHDTVTHNWWESTTIITSCFTLSLRKHTVYSFVWITIIRIQPTLIHNW